MVTRLNHNITFSRQLWLSVMMVFFVITTCFMVYQYRREKAYRADIIDTELQTYNLLLSKNQKTEIPPDIRLTILDIEGNVVYDNVDNTANVNHLNRPEIKQALVEGKGRDIRRKSATVGDDFFYSATRFDSLIVRTALPYNHSLIDMLTADKDFVWLSIAIVIILALIYELYTQRVGRMIEAHRRKMENRLEQSEEDKQRMKRQLTQNVAHELKTPVGSIQGMLDILVNDHNMPETERQKFLERSYAQANRLANLLRDISMLTRIDDAPAGFEKMECNLYEIVENVISDLAENLKKQEDTISNKLPSNIAIQGSYSLLYSIFRNLIDNSIAYAGEGITITIETGISDDSSDVRIIYKDNGRGVSEDHLPYLFERFYRVDKGRSRSMGGTGLGLAIVKHAVILHDGCIEAMPAPGGGLQFEFTLNT